MDWQAWGENAGICSKNIPYFLDFCNLGLVFLCVLCYNFMRRYVRVTEK